MAQIPSAIKETIDKFLSLLEMNNIHVQQAVLFGSYAKGKQHEWSDIDLAVVSESFQGVRFYDSVALAPYTVAVSSSLEPLPYRPEDFTPDDPFVREILETGVRVA